VRRISPGAGLDDGEVSVVSGVPELFAGAVAEIVASLDRDSILREARSAIMARLRA